MASMEGQEYLPLICEEEVVPILGSIVDTDGNSLKDIQLPQKWHRARNRCLYWTNS